MTRIGRILSEGRPFFVVHLTNREVDKNVALKPLLDRLHSRPRLKSLLHKAGLAASGRNGMEGEKVL